MKKVNKNDGALLADLKRDIRRWCEPDIKDYRIRSFLSIWHSHGDLCKHLGIDSSTDLDDRYSNLFLNAYINRHAHT